MTKNGDAASEARYRMLDLLRGVTVFLMIAAHAVYFFHNDTNAFLGLIEKFGNTVAFTTFLIVSGATAFIAYFSREDVWPEKKKRLFKRIRVLLFGYFVIAFVVFFGDIVASHGLAKLYFIIDILTFRKMPPFGEFYLPFIVFPFIICLLPRFFRKLSKSIALTLAFALMVYLIGMFLYRVPVPEFFVPWKALLVGAQGYYRFPIFQYFPVYLLGMAWGYRLITTKRLKSQTEIAEAVMLTSGLGIFFTVIGFMIFGKTMEEIFRRWPPSITFLLVGIFFASVLALFFYITKQLKRTPLLRDGILVMGQNALGLALTHIFLLQIYTLAGGLRTGSVFLYLAGFAILLFLSIAIAAIVPFNFRFALDIERGDYHEDLIEKEALIKFEEEATEDLEQDVKKVERYFFIGKKAPKGDEALIKRRHVLGASLVLALSAFVIFPPIAEEYQMQKINKQGVDWYDSDLPYRQKLVIKNTEALAEIPKKKVIKANINHAELVLAKKSYQDGKDLVILYWDGKKYENVRFSLDSGINQANMVVSIELKERLKPGAVSNNYYLYYGNNLAKTASVKGLENPIQLKYAVTYAEEEAYPALLTVDRRWSILSNDPKIPKTLRVTLSTDEDYDSQEAEYVLEGPGTRGKLEKTAEKQWEGVIDTSKLEPGEYRLSANIKGAEGEINSSTVGFFVSKPLYIAWTQDWEGYDVPDVYLAAITQVARDHGLVMTHFWNPRLTLTDSVAVSRKERLVEWLKTRQSAFGESVQLHLHMFNDFVAASGVTPKNSPNWGDSGDGYGALTTNYSAEEQTKLISKGIELMRASGFVPTMFRAGGWFANEATLKAVENSGLLADSSGRTAYNFFSQKGPWNLTKNAQPYYPSETDQNRAGNPSLKILEIPNNGADSYWFSSEEMKDRFYANYPGGILTEPKQITYLSHPHWFNKSEQQKVKGLFNLIDQYKYENDYGPALYVTLDEIYKVWKK